MALSQPVEKGWRAVITLPKGRVMRSRVYHVRQAADEYAAQAAKAFPDAVSIEVKTVIGFEGEAKELQR